MANSRNNSTVSAQEIFGAIQNVNSTVNQGVATNIQQTRNSEQSIKQHVTATAEQIFAGQANLNTTINQGTATTVAQVRSSERNLSAQIAKLAPRAYETLDYLIIALSSLIGGILGWFYSQEMIRRGFAVWVKTVETTTFNKDGYGNIIDITTTSSSETVWATVVLTIILFAIIGGLLGWILAGHRTKEGA